jgi:ABC-type uncharacterized transport system substrate-binding protein
MGSFRSVFPILVLLITTTADAAKIAAIFKLNDPYSVFPQDIVKGMKFALSKSSHKEKIEFRTFSHDGDPESIQKTVEAAKKFNPEIVIAGETSQFAMTIARAFQDKIFITPTASTYQLQEVHKTPIRMIHIDDQYVKIVEFLAERRDLGKVGVFHNLSYPNTNRISQKITEYLKSRNTRFSVVQHLNGEEITKSKLEPFLISKIDTLIIFTYDSDLRRVYSVLKENNLHPFYVGGDGWGRDSFLKEYLLTPESKFKGVRTLYWNPEGKQLEFIKLKHEFEAAIGSNIDAFHSIGYDTMKVVVECLDSDGGTSKFLTNIRSKKFSHLLTTSALSFGINLEPIKDMYLFKIDANGIKYESRVPFR